MQLPASLFLACKYLRPKRSFLSVVTVISMLGVLLGVAILIVVLSVMSGFDGMWREKILSFNAHVSVTGWGEIEDAEEVRERIKTVDGVTGAAPFIQGLVLIKYNDRLLTPFLRGIHPQHEHEVSRLPQHIVSGVFCVDNDGIVLGRDLARQIGVGVGERLLVYTPHMLTSPDEIYLPSELTVTGIFELGMWDFDMGYAVTSLATARDLYGMESGVHGLQVMTSDPYRAALSAALIRDALGPEYEARTWMELNRQLFAALRVEKNMMFFLLIFITIVAAFGITNTLITVTVQKTREIGLLKALGFGSESIMGIFVWQGLIAGVCGTLLGIGTGLMVLRHRNHLMYWLNARLGMELLPKEIYHLTEIPSHTAWTDVLTVSVAVIIICTLAGVIPAYRAARLDPARALRYE